jgi:hypothetical protein
MCYVVVAARFARTLVLREIFPAFGAMPRHEPKCSGEAISPSRAQTTILARRSGSIIGTSGFLLFASFARLRALRRAGFLAGA